MTFKCMFVNERNETVVMQVVLDENGIRYSATGTTSPVQQWTPLEARVLQTLLIAARNF